MSDNGNGKGESKERGWSIFGKGIPTAPDVDALIEKIGVPQPGEQISYATVSKIIGVDRKSSRWNSVTGAWRKRLEDDHGVFMTAVMNVGFEVLSDNGKVQEIAGQAKRAVNRLKRADKVARRVDVSKLSAENKHVFDHYGRVRASIELADRTAAKQLAYPDPA